ncbi:hypothetical protein ACFW04_010788 [Cataglyphis niger]
MRVAIVGAGVIGVTSALAVKNAFPSYDVKIFADAFSPDTTGDGSAGLWSPYLLGDTPIDNITRWASCTHQWFEQLWKAGLSSKTGVSLIPVTRVTSDCEDDINKQWTKLVYGFQKLTDEKLQRLNEEHKSNYKQAWHFITYTAEPFLLLPWLMERFIALGGKMEKRNIKTLHELAEEGYDLIINCSGLGARELVADKTVTSIRGQVYRACKIIRSWVGLRPGRPRVRLECETLSSPTGKEIKVIHNYGHGGSGVTLCWGCATDVVEMIRNLKVQELNSKL